MTTILNQFTFIMTLTIMAFACSACSIDNQDEPCEDNQNANRETSENEKKLFDSSWKLISNTYNGIPINDNIGDIITFSSTSYGDYKGYNLSLWYSLYINGEKMGAWHWEESALVTEYTPWDPMARGRYNVIYGNGAYLQSISTTQLIFQNDSEKWVYSRENCNTDGGNSNYEKPEICYYDFTPGTTTLKVIFEIGNKESTKLTSAKGFCGSKSVDGSIGSKLITFNFSGLRKGTKYKVHCKVDGPGGSAISDTVTLSTLY